MTCKGKSSCFRKKIIFSIGNINSKGNYKFNNIEFGNDDIIIGKPLCHFNIELYEIKCFYLRKVSYNNFI